MCKKHEIKTLFLVFFVGLSSLINVLAQANYQYFHLQNTFKHPSQLTSNAQLPDPFLMKDGKRVSDTNEWMQQREYLKEMLTFYQYGEAPPAPIWTGTITSPVSLYNGKAIERTVTMALQGATGNLNFQFRLVYPSETSKKFPVIIMSSSSTKGATTNQQNIVETRGYAYVVFNRSNISGDNTTNSGVYTIYPNYTWGTLKAWSWGYSRVIDYLATLDFIDMEKIVVTGHSRWGKAAMLAGIYDERIAITVPNGSGTSGMNSFRLSPCTNGAAETLYNISSTFPNWFSLYRSPEEQRIFSTFVTRENYLPFDQHFARALIAPRALLNTDALSDWWACPPGTQLTAMAAQPVFDFLDVPYNNASHYRAGTHEQNTEDFAALLDFSDMYFFQKPTTRNFYAKPFPNINPNLQWSMPIPASINSTILGENETIIYPNPATDKIRIKLKNPTCHVIKVYMINSMGQELIAQEAKVIDNHISLDFNQMQFKDGIYFLKIKYDESRSEQQKLIVKN